MIAVTTLAPNRGDRGFWPLRRLRGRRVSLYTKLILSFILVILLMSAVFIVVGVELISDRVVAEAQERVRTDLNAAREMYATKQNEIGLVMRMTANRQLLRSALVARDMDTARDILTEVRIGEGFDVLNATDASGRLILRTGNTRYEGQDLSGDPMIRAVMESHQPVAATVIVPAEELARESSDLTLKARFELIPTARSRAQGRSDLRDGMMLKSVTPVVGEDGELLAILYGGVLLNRNFEIVDKIKKTVFQDVTYKGKDIGTATIFQDDVRVSTNVTNKDGTRAIGTLASAEVYDKVVNGGGSWIGRAFVVNDWYITAYEPIRDFGNNIIGMLYVGILEQKYTDIRWSTIKAFLFVSLLGSIGAVALAYLISRGFSSSLREVVTKSRRLADGDLDANIDVRSNDEMGELAATLNSMATALKERDERLQEMARARVRRSERLAMVGQLAAGVAHELNNPMQGIVAYSMLLLEEMPAQDSRREIVDQIVAQANRCTKIVRGLLDFSRQKQSESRPTDITRVINDTVSLVEKQALFHNIAVVREFSPDLPEITVDPGQIQQVFMNLVINAAEAMEGNGTLTLRTRLVPREPAVEIAVSDTGHGISPEHMERVFVPFFTTKEQTHGVGLGLAISYRIVREHGGTINVESEVGKGTTFTVRLPVADAEDGDGID